MLEGHKRGMALSLLIQNPLVRLVHPLLRYDGGSWFDLDTEDHA